MSSRRARLGAWQGRGGRAAGALLGLGLTLMPLCAFAAAPTGATGPADATASAGALDTAEFDRTLLSGAGQNTTDLSRFERGNPVLPGIYRVDVYLNGQPIGRSDVRFAAATPEASATPCIDRDLFDQLGLPTGGLTPAQREALATPSRCVDVASLVPDASVSFDQSNLRLDISVPQASLGLHARGYVSPENWDAGVPAMLLNYNFNGYRSHSAGQTQTTAYLGVKAGLNIGLWHLRHDGSLDWQSGLRGARSRRHWQNIDTYVQRDLPDWRAQLTLGDAFTSGDLFDSVRLRGVRLATNDRMLPDSLRGYAPVVRGVADSNAKVSIRQNGALIYQTTVAPGPFVISDLYPTGYGGDLQVTVAEADGRIKAFSVPFASVPQLLRPGVSRFDATLGQLKESGLAHSPLIGQLTVQRGLTNLLTGYAGVVGSDGYAAALLGSALNTRFGALALDLTGARTAIPGQSSLTGESVRLSYSKILPQTDTSLSVATYRYSTSGYLGLRDALLARDYARGGSYPAGTDPLLLAQLNATDPTRLPSVLSPSQQLLLGNGVVDPVTGQFGRQRSRFDLTLNQQLGDRGGSLYASGSARDYWNRSGTDVQFQVGYSNHVGTLSYSVSATRSRGVDGASGNQFFVSFTLPLGDSAHAPSLNGNLSHDRVGGTLEQLTLNGSAGAANQFSYGATGSHGDQAGSAASVYGSYRNPHGILHASYGAGSDYSQASFGAAGAVVAYPGGVSFGQPTGDTVGIVVAPHASGARVGNAPGLSVDRYGHALVPYLTPYHLNTVELDPRGLPLDVQLDATSARVAPYAGAVVLLEFKTTSGRSLIVQVRREDGSAVPFGADVVDAGDTSLGVVGQAGHILLRGISDRGELSVRWQDDAGADHRCTFAYQAPAKPSQDGASRYVAQSAVCREPPLTLAAKGSSRP